MTQAANLLADEAGPAVSPIERPAAQSTIPSVATPDNDGSFPRGLIVATAIALPFWGLLGLGFYLSR